MALVVNENSYVSLDSADSFFETRLDSSKWLEASPEDRIAALVTATRMIDNNFQFVGGAVSGTQTLAWPRQGAAYAEPKTGRVEVVPDTVVPIRVVEATLEQAYHLLVNENLVDSTTQTFERIKVGPIEVEDKASDYKPPSIIGNTVKKILKPLLANRGGNTWWRAN